MLLIKKYVKTGDLAGAASLGYNGGLKGERYADQNRAKGRLSGHL